MHPFRTTVCTDQTSTVAYAQNHYFGPSALPTFTYNPAAACGHSVSGSINYVLDVGLKQFNVPDHSVGLFSVVGTVSRIVISVISKRTITIDGHKTSVTLEDEFWYGLREIARRKNATLRFLITQIDDARERNNLSSAIRVFVLNYFRARAFTLGGDERGS